MIIHDSKHPKFEYFNEINEEAHGSGSLNVIKRVYVTSIEIGHQQLFLVFDTGSHFTWVQWESCRLCLPSQPPIIASYRVTRDFLFERCDRTLGNNCKYKEDTPNSVCELNVCMYQVKYKDQSGSLGFVSTEVVTPFTNKTISQRMVFGMGLDNKCFPEYSCFQGVAGFGAGPLAIPFQLTPRPTRWAFCLPLNQSMDGSFMVGDDAQILGEYKTAPLIDHKYYYLTILSEIFVIGKGKIPAPNTTTILIDTGATFSYLEDSMFDDLVSMLKEHVKETYDDSPVLGPYVEDLDLELCYLKPHQIEITIVIGDAYLLLADPEKVWWKYTEYVYCLSFKRNGRAPHSTLGNLHIRGYKVAYDLNPKQQSIQISTGQEEAGCFTPIAV
ncbi:aspartic proteinase nepenthesin-2-like [Silene latifolia]|uniref:aspartic proteinase nepenthesin-2-like n=1 Tax=Silene latifolia TaxID=37657 RepID=UPI003D76EA60